MTENEKVLVVPVLFHSARKPYCFSTTLQDLKEGDYVIVDTVRGLEIGRIVGNIIPLENYKSTIPLKEIIKKADEFDVEKHEQNIKDAETAFNICLEEISNLDLKMRLLSAEYTFDRTKITFTYVADNRVDFRELVKILGSRLRTRIEMHQIGSREKAKMVGGIGICGLPLCCATFLKSFERITTKHVKNQNLTLGNDKINGLCSSFICCLRYENDYYEEANKLFPPIGTKLTYKNNNYKVASYNVLSRKVKLVNDDAVENVSLDELDGLWTKKEQNEAQ